MALMSSNKHKYSCHKSKANARGIDFELTFEEWWNIWEQSGKWEQRGCRKGQYVMSRYNDSGSYIIGNVFIQEHSKNVSEAQTGYKRPKKTEDHLNNFRKAFALVPLNDCPHCDKKIKGKSNLTRHMEAKHVQQAA
jgi:hypothetical protein